MLRALVLALAVAASVSTVQPAAAQTPAPTCAPKVVKATGGGAILEGAARGKARSAWIKRVSAAKKLGPSYAVWLRAKNHTYSCRKAGKVYVCDAIATPCKS